MTDPLDTDLRTPARPARRGGDRRPPRRRDRHRATGSTRATPVWRRWSSIAVVRAPSLAAGGRAAAVVVAIGAAAVLLQDDEPNVRTGPSATVPAVPATVLEFRPVQASGPCEALGASRVPVAPTATSATSSAIRSPATT